MTNQCHNTHGEAGDLDSVMAAYQALPADQLVADTLLLTYNQEDGPRLAGASVFGFTRAGQYLDTARGLIDQIVANTDQISWHMTAYAVIRDGIGDDYDASPLAQPDFLKREWHLHGAKTLSLQSEVHWHLYAECLDRAWYFMRNSTSYLDPKFTLKLGQQDYIVTIREFRNHMAHRDKAVLNIDSPDWASLSRSKNDSFEIGYKRDNRNRIAFSPVDGDLKGRTLKMPLSWEGFQRFKNIIAYTKQHLQHSCLDTLSRQFAEHPESMPLVHQVGKLMQDGIDPAEA